MAQRTAVYREVGRASVSRRPMRRVVRRSVTGLSGIGGLLARLAGTHVLNGRTRPHR